MADSRCGLICTGCAWKESNGCGGCIETMGNPFHGECVIAICCQEKGHTHCGECALIPCPKLIQYSYLDPEHGDVPQGKRVEVCRRWAAQSGKNVWDKVLLTSAGFEDYNGNPKVNIIDCFLRMLDMPIAEAKILFVPTAAVDKETRELAKLCKQELINIGAKEERIHVYEIDGSMKEDEAMSYDVIYFTGGDTNYLLRCIKEAKFDKIIKKMVAANKVYVGVSAGSLIATPNIGNAYEARTAGLCLLNAYLDVHCNEQTPAREDLPLIHIPLTDNQAIAVSWEGYQLIEG